MANKSVSCNASGIGGIYWLFAIIYTFSYWGFWWGVLNIFLPFAPIVDLVKRIGRI